MSTDGEAVLLRLAESLMPGLRSIRPALFSGALWLIVIWLSVGDWIGNSALSGRQLSQIRAAIDYLGPSGTLTLVFLTAFVVGMVTEPVQRFAASIASAPIRRTTQSLAWQRLARDYATRTEAQISQLENSIAQQRSGMVQRAEDDQKRASFQHSIDRSMTRLQELREQRDAVRPIFRTRWLRNTSKARTIVGSPRPGDTAEFYVVLQAAERGAAVEIERRDPFISVDNLHLEIVAHDLFGSLRSELEPDALDVLRALDEPLFLEFDRLRSEREVRVATSLPLMAMGALLASRLLLPGVAVTLLSLALLIHSLWLGRGEKDRVLNQISLRGLKTPTLMRAEMAGRERVLEWLQDQERNKRQMEEFERTQRAQTSS